MHDPKQDPDLDLKLTKKSDPDPKKIISNSQYG
jgi:hypothetical protein